MWLGIDGAQLQLHSEQTGGLIIVQPEVAGSHPENSDEQTYEPINNCTSQWVQQGELSILNILLTILQARLPHTLKQTKI